MNVVEAFLKQADLGEFRPSQPLCTLVLTPRFPASRHVVFLLLTRDRGELVMVAKMPRLRDSGNNLAREAQNLQSIQSLRPGGFDTIPRVLAYDTYCGYPILVETAVPGQLVLPVMVRRDSDRFCRAVIEWLGELHLYSTPGETWYEQIAAPPLRYLENYLADEDGSPLAQLRSILAPLKDAHLPLVVEHGDLSHPNLMLMPTGRIGVVDWELSEIRGMVCADLFFVLAYVAFSLNRVTATGQYLAPFRAAFFGPEAWTTPYILKYLAKVPIASSLLAPLFVLCWTRYLCNLIRRLRVSEDEPVEPVVLDQIRQNGYYTIWRYAVQNAHDLAVANLPVAEG